MRSLRYVGQQETIISSEYRNVPIKTAQHAAAPIPADRKTSREKTKTAKRTGIQQQKCFDIVKEEKKVGKEGENERGDESNRLKRPVGRGSYRRSNCQGGPGMCLPHGGDTITDFELIDRVYTALQAAGRPSRQ